jgi:hypothetical protein
MQLKLLTLIILLFINIILLMGYHEQNYAVSVENVIHICTLMHSVYKFSPPT